MNNASLELGGTNWAEKDGNILGYSVGDTSGKFSPQEFTFARGSNLSATRINKAGLIVKGRENLVLQSNQFDTTWAAVGINRTSGQSGYDGNNNAWKIESTNTGQSRIAQTISISGVNTISFYAKAGTANYIVPYIIGSGDPRAFFNLSTGVVGTTAYNIDASMEDVGGGWYRCSMTLERTSSSLWIFIGNTDGNFNSAIGDSIYIQDAQLEQGLAASPYIETTSTTAEAGVLENTPRLNYTTGVANPYLLLEPSRTNLIPQSEYIASWNLVNAVATSNDIISPEGVQNATKIVTSANGMDLKLTSISVSANTTYTYSFYCNLTSGTGLQGRFYDNTNGANIEYYTYDSQLTTGEWKRVERTFTTPVGCTNIQVWLLASSSTLVTAHYWGAQLEAGTYPTSYIPTYGTSQTRAADSCSKTDASDVIGQTEGTVFIDINNRVLSPYPNEYVFYLTGTGSSQLWLRKESGGNNFTARLVVGGSNIWTISVVPPNGLTKIALAYKSGDSVVYLNGTQVNTSSATYSGNVLEDFYFSSVASAYPELKLNQATLFKERLTNAELATLTTI